MDWERQHYTMLAGKSLTVGQGITLFDMYLHNYTLDSPHNIIHVCVAVRYS